MVTLPVLFTASVAMPPKLFSTLPAAFMAFAFMGAIGSGKLGGGVQFGVCEA